MARERISEQERTARAIYRAMIDLSNFGDDSKEQVIRRIVELLEADSWPSVAAIASRMIRKTDNLPVIATGKCDLCGNDELLYRVNDDGSKLYCERCAKGWLQTR